MIEEEYTYKDPEETEQEPEHPGIEIVKEKVIENKDPRYFYFINKEGGVGRRLRETARTRKKKEMINYFDKIDLSVPKVLLSGYVSKKFKTVRRTGPNGGMIWVPPSLIGKAFQVILIPKEDWIISQSGNIEWH